MPTSAHHRARSSIRTPLRKILLMAATVVLTTAFAASPASAKPVTTTTTIHDCFPQPVGTVCFDQTITTFTNTVQQGDLLAVHIRVDAKLGEVNTGGSCIVTRQLDFSVTAHSVHTPGHESGVTHTVTTGTLVLDCGSGTFECTIDATFHEVQQPDGLFRTVFDRDTGTCD